MIWNFIQNEILGMQWLKRGIGSLLSLVGLDPGNRIGSSIRFFLYDTVKIMVLLGVLILLQAEKTWKTREILNAAGRSLAGFMELARISSVRC